MRFDDFVKLVADTLENDGHNVIVNKCMKNNAVEYTGIIIKEGDGNIFPTIYLEQYYESFCNGVAIEEIIEKILEINESNKGESFDVEMLKEFDNIKDKICYRLVNKEANRQRLTGIPHTEFLDLAKIYYIQVKSRNEDIMGSIIINNEMLMIYQVTLKELDRIATKNTEKLEEIHIKSMKETLMQLADIEEMKNIELQFNDDMYVVTNSSKCNGASCLCYASAMKMLVDKMKCDKIYIIPSSIHELIAVKLTDEMDEIRIKQIIEEVNATQVSAEEKLSDNLYYYDVERNEIRIC